MKINGFGGPKTRKIMEKTLPKSMLFSSVFFNGFWRGLELILGRVWGPFGVSWVTSGDIFWCLYFNLSPKVFPEALGTGFGLIFHDLEANFGFILALFWPNFGSILASNHCVLAKWKSFLKYYHQTKGWRGSYSKWWWNHVMRCQKHLWWWLQMPYQLPA